MSRPTIVHVTANFGPIDENTARRMKVARQSWVAEQLLDGKMCAVEVQEGEAPSMDGVPYLKSLTAGAWKQLQLLGEPHGIIFITNADIGMVHGTGRKIREAVAAHGSCHMKRRDFDSIGMAIHTDTECANGVEYIGMDGCAFTADWWGNYGPIVPDLLIGRYGWDCVMRNLIRQTGGIELKNLLWHEKHESAWLNWGQWRDIPGNQYNEALVDSWLAQFGGSKQDHLLSDEAYKETIR